MVRQLARHCRAIDPRTIIPPPDLIPYQYQRPAPYFYSDDDQITRLLQAARRLQSATGLRSLTYSTLFGLNAVTGSGMRHNEAIQLDRGDVDLVNGVVAIRCAKFGKYAACLTIGDLCESGLIFQGKEQPTVGIVIPFLTGSRGSQVVGRKSRNSEPRNVLSDISL
jgi:hypothetical protein